MSRIIGRVDIPPHPCPVCGVVARTYTVREGGPPLPVEGGLMFHRVCRKWVAVVADGVRPATPEEVAAWKARPRGELR